MSNESTNFEQNLWDRILSKASTALLDNGDVVKRITFDPMGTDHTLQQLITAHLHQLIAKSDYTLAELGYLHASSVSFVKDHIETKIYFVPELATHKKQSSFRSTSSDLVLHPGFKEFQNHVFLGDPDAAIRVGGAVFMDMAVPKYHIDTDDAGLPAIVIKDGHKLDQDGETLAVYANIDIILASYLNLSLFDPNFAVSYQTIGNGDNQDAEHPAIMISMGAEKEFPVRVTVQWSADNAIPYEPETAVAYLIERAKKEQIAAESRKEIASKVSKEAKEATKRQRKNTTSWTKFR